MLYVYTINIFEFWGRIGECSVTYFLAIPSIVHNTLVSTHAITYDTKKNVPAELSVTKSGKALHIMLQALEVEGHGP